MGKIINNLPDGNDKCYIEHDRETIKNNYNQRRSRQRTKKEIHQTIFNVEYKFARLINKEEQKEYRKIKKNN